MPRQQPKVVHVAVAVIERKGKVLICQRRKQDSFGGYWEFPGGKCLPKESWLACVKREVSEELGVRVTKSAPFGKLYHRLRARQAYFRIFRCRINGANPKPLASQRLRWVAISKLGEYRFPPVNKPLLTRLRLLSKAASSAIITVTR